MCTNLYSTLRKQDIYISAVFVDVADLLARSHYGKHYTAHVQSIFFILMNSEGMILSE